MNIGEKIDSSPDDQRSGNRGLSDTRPLRYCRDETQLSQDMAIFINGLPLAMLDQYLRQSVALGVAVSAAGGLFPDNKS